MARPIHVLIRGLGLGGGQGVCATVTLGLVQRGWDVTMVTSHTGDLDSYPQLRGCVIHETLPFRRARYALWALYRWLRTERPTMVLVFNQELAVFMVVARVLARIDTVIVARPMNTLSAKAGTVGGLYRYITDPVIRLLYRHVDHVIAQSDGMRGDLIARYALDANHVTRIHNPVASRIWETPLCSAVAYGRDICFIGRLSLQKNVGFIIQAFELVHERMPDTRLVIAGEGDERAKLEADVEARGLDDVVVFRGIVNPIDSVYDSVGVVVLASRFEGFPNVLTEALARGCPVVALDCPSGPSEIIRDGINGRLVREVSEEHFAAAVCEVLSWQPDRHRIRESAEIFSPETIIDQYDVLLRDFAPGNDATRSAFSVHT